ncbi:MAG: hypoxanthine phosphoribosyltransferase [Bacteroidota bacterium]
MKKVKILDKEFALSIKEEEILKAVDMMAEKINREMNGKNPVFIVILNGAFMFASDLFKKLNIPCEISFVKLSSYIGTKTSENVKTLIGLSDDIKGRNIIVLEDIVDSGHTVEDILESLKRLAPADVKIATLLFKPNAYLKKIDLDYVGIEIPNDFIVGYGLDYDGYGRNLADIYKIID